MILHHECFHIRKSAGRSLFAAHRSLSQLVTSFVGSWCQGIRPVLFIAWTFSCSFLAWVIVDNRLKFCLTPQWINHCLLFHLLRWNCSFPTLQKNLYFFHLHDLDLIFIISFQCWLSVRFTLHLLYLVFNDHKKLALFFGGLKWTRTTDLALIRRAL